jgi:hypothetical protein
MVILAGFSFDAPAGHLGFAPKVQSRGTFQSFWSGGNAYGTVSIERGKAKLSVAGGELRLKSLGLPLNGKGGVVAKATLRGKPVTINAANGSLAFANLRMKPGDVLEIEAPGLSLKALPDIASLQ